ncbi:MAG TPA: DUF883 family protein [Burkholderiales bacterium]|nr:DUF883 family protein [Burkholderiales bacterium]
MTADNPNVVTREKLIDDMRTVIADAEELLRATANEAGDKIAVARERIQDSLYRAKVKLAETEDVLLDHTRQAARLTDDFVHDNPWKAVGIAAGIGLLIGMLIGRR